MDNDITLIERAIEGDKSAFGDLVDKYKGKIVGAAFRFSGNYKDAEDVAQEVFLKAYLNLAKFRKEADFSTWLYRITYNTACNYVRKKKIKMTTLKDDIRYEDEFDIERNEKREIVRAALEKLPLKLKSVLVFREYESLSYKEIAGVLDCSIGTVESRISRAREKLKVLLRPYILEGEKI